MNVGEASEIKKEGNACNPVQADGSQARPFSRETMSIYGHIAGRPDRWSRSIPDPGRFHIRRNYETAPTVLETKEILVNNRMN